MVSLSRLIEVIPPSPTISAGAKAAALKAQGKDVVSMTVGEPDFDTPQHVKDGAMQALEKGLTKYTAAEGILPLREVISAKLKREQKVDLSPKEIIVTNGGKQAIAAACAVLLNPGDEVVIPAPYWTSYPDMVKLFGGKPVIVQTDAKTGFIMSPKQMLAACTSKTKMIILNSPSNPTGACYSNSDLRALADAFQTLKNKDEITILTDEVYEYITFGGFKQESIITIAPELKDNILIVNAFSKSYSMTGWRVGYAAGNKKIIDAMAVHQSQFTSNVCSIAQYAALKAFDDNGAFPKQMTAEFEKRLDYVWNAVKAMPGIELSVKPRGAFYAFLEVDGLLGKKDGNHVINSGQNFADYLLDKFDVVVVQGEAFGSKSSVRISFALNQLALEKGLGRIHEAATRLS